MKNAAMYVRKGFVIAVLLILFQMGHMARAGEVYLNNGDRVSGKITKMEDDTLTVEVSYADDSADLIIDWDNVIRVEFDQPVEIQIREEGMEEDEDDFVPTKEVEVKTLGGPEDIPLKRVEAIKIPEVRYRGNLDVGGNQASGNTNTSALNLSLDGRVWSERHRMDVQARYNYSEQDGEDTANNARLNLIYRYFFTKRWFLGATQFFEQDRFQDLTIRSTSSLNVGRQFFDTDRHDLLGSLGVAYIYEKFEDRNGTTTPGGTWLIQWSYEAISDKLELFHKQNGTRDFGTSQAFRWNADQGIRVTLFDDFYLNLEFDFRFNSEPDPGTETTDESIIVGIGYKWKN